MRSRYWLRTFVISLLISSLSLASPTPESDGEEEGLLSTIATYLSAIGMTAYLVLTTSEPPKEHLPEVLEDHEDNIRHDGDQPPRASNRLLLRSSPHLEGAGCALTVASGTAVISPAKMLKILTELASKAIKRALEDGLVRQRQCMRSTISLMHQSYCTRNRALLVIRSHSPLLPNRMFFEILLNVMNPRGPQPRITNLDYEPLALRSPTFPGPNWDNQALYQYARDTRHPFDERMTAINELGSRRESEEAQTMLVRLIDELTITLKDP